MYKDMWTSCVEIKYIEKKIPDISVHWTFIKNNRPEFHIQNLYDAEY